MTGAGFLSKVEEVFNAGGVALVFIIIVLVNAGILLRASDPASYQMLS